MTFLESLVQRWREEATVLRSWGAEPQALAAEHAADRLDAHLRAGEGESVNLTEGAALSGFTADHLGRLIREGKIQNVGRPGAPQILVVDLPRKAGGVQGRDPRVLAFEHGKRRSRGGLEKTVERGRVRVQRGGDAS